MGFFSDIIDTVKDVAGPVLGAATGNPWISAGASMLGGMMTNESNAENMKDSWAFNQASSREQMAWQERMSNTAHQREVADLRAAGLNPILSVNHGGASTPSGSSASSNVIPMQNFTPQTISSAQAQERLNADLELIKAQQAKTYAETLTELRRPSFVEAQTRTEDQRPGLVQEQAGQARAQANLADKQAVHEIGKQALTDEMIQHERGKTALTAEMARRTLAETLNINSLTSLHTSQARSAAVEADLDEGMRKYERIIRMGEGASSAVRNLYPGLDKLLGKRAPPGAPPAKSYSDPESYVR